MQKSKFSKKACMVWMLVALTALGLGQTLGLFLTREEHTGRITVPVPAQVLVTGTVIRQEQVIRVPFPGFWETDSEPRRVSAGQVLLTLRSQEATEKRAQRILDRAETAALALPRRRENIHLALAQGDSAAIMALVGGETDVSEAEVAEAREILRSGAFLRQTVCAPEGGIFVPVTDGLEEILLPEYPQVEWADLPESPRDELAAGRLITSDNWCFWGEFPQNLAPGDQVSVLLLSGVFQEAEFTVLETEEMENGGCRALCICREHIASVAKLRNLTVKILRESEIRGGNFLANTV